MARTGEGRREHWTAQRQAPVVRLRLSKVPGMLHDARAAETSVPANVALHWTMGGASRSAIRIKSNC